ncbi:MAG: hypothetical protein LBS56_07960, partial [Propionibacteriaceae bacterium]|nr:hypothetical protein [Propionibacteriaceae bacterium]
MAHAHSDYKIARSVAMPFYIVCDISGSMCESPKAGHAVPVDIIEENLPGIIDAIQDDKLASSIVWLSIIEFGSTARRILDLKSISDPKIQVDGLSRGGATNYEAVFSLLADTLETDIERLRREN